MSIGTDLVRSWYGLDTELVRTWLYPDKDETKKMSCTSLLAIWHWQYDNFSNKGKSYLQYTIQIMYFISIQNTKTYILFQFKTQLQQTDILQVTKTRVIIPI